jgi:hypothetical protein
MTVPERAELAQRLYGGVYSVRDRADLHAFLLEAVRRSGGTILLASPPDRAPVFLGIQAASDERVGVLCYPFRCNPPPIAGRDPDEHRVQVRYGGERSWAEQEHWIGRDVAGVDTTVVLGVHIAADILIGLDPALYDPLPMGISVEFKQAEVDTVLRDGWHAWERMNRPGRRREAPRAREGLECVVGLRPERLLDYIRFERQATGLGLDPALRLVAAEHAGIEPPSPSRGLHPLEEQFQLPSEEILEIIAERTRLAVAVRGGVAEHHLATHLHDDAELASALLVDRDGEPDFRVTMRDGREILVECKNVSPRPYADGSLKVEVQKTRSQRDDPAGRLYRLDQFDLVAACLYSVTKVWEFRFKRTNTLARSDRWPDRLAPLQRVDATWSRSISEALGRR